MRNVLFAFILMNVGISAGYACNICGCGVGGSMMGLISQFRTSYIGLRCSVQPYRVTHPPSFETPDMPLIFNEYFGMSEVWGMYSVNKKFRVIGVLPYRLYSRGTPEYPLSKYGFGDVSVSGQYQLAGTPDSSLAALRYWVNIGSGVVLPTGCRNNPSNRFLESQLPGSGYVQGSIFTNATLRYRNWGGILEGDTRLAISTPPGSYRMDMYRTAFTAFRVFQFTKLMAMPSLGASFSLFDVRINGEERIDEMVSLQGGVQFTIRRTTVGFQTEIPLSQNFSNGSVNALPRLQLQAGVAF